QSGRMEQDLAAQLEASRPRPQSVAYRMLGSLTQAEDAVQETLIRLSRSDADSSDNLAGWLTTVLPRASARVLRSRRTLPRQPTAPTGGRLGVLGRLPRRGLRGASRAPRRRRSAPGRPRRSGVGGGQPPSGSAPTRT